MALSGKSLMLLLAVLGSAGAVLGHRVLAADGRGDVGAEFMEDEHVSRRVLAFSPAPTPKTLTTGSFKLPLGMRLASFLNNSCGSPIPSATLTTIISCFMEAASRELPDQFRFPGNETNMAKCKAILANELTRISAAWPTVKTLAMKYFNWTLPNSPLELLAKYSIDLPVRRRSRQLLQKSGPPFTVSTYVFVITDSSAEGGGGKTVTIDSVNLQIDKLNKEYAKTGFSFNLVKAYGIEDPAWYSADDYEENGVAVQRRSQYRQGGDTALNLYIREPSAQGLGEGSKLLGNAFFPFWLCQNGQRESGLSAYDGVSVWWYTLPGQSATGSAGAYEFDGATTVHEVGHWLGLKHTFGQPDSGDGSCSPADGDGITDTPLEYSAYNQRDPTPGACDTQVDSCPRDPGDDPITNWMDYSADSCYTSFSPQQITRMQQTYYYFRVQGQCSLSGAPIGGSPPSPESGNPSPATPSSTPPSKTPSPGTPKSPSPSTPSPPSSGVTLHPGGWYLLLGAMALLAVN